MSKALSWTLLALAPLWYALAVQPARQQAQNQEIARTASILEHGLRWDFSQPASLVGGQPIGVDTWRFSPEGLLLERVASGSYVPLNFQGLRLPADKLTRLRIELTARGADRLLLFHRSRLDGPAARSRAIPLREGHQRLELDARDLEWTVQGKTAPWGQREGTLATLRLHPAGGPANLTLIELALQPGRAAPNASRADTNGSEERPVLTETAAGRWRERWHSWSTVAFRSALNDYRLQPAFWGQDAQAGGLVPGAKLYLPLALLLLLLMTHAPFRPAAAVVLLVVSLGWGFSQSSWHPAGVIACFCALLLCFFVRYAPTTAPPSVSDPQRAPRTSSRRDLLHLFLLLGLLLALLLATDDQPGPWRLEPGRWLIYLGWVTIQQWLLCTLLYPLPRMAGATVPTAIGVAAGVFGFSHLPNLELMIMTWLLALGCLWHYSRHHRLQAPIALHTAAGSVLLAVAPTPMLYSASAGPGFWF